MRQADLVLLHADSMSFSTAGMALIPGPRHRLKGSAYGGGGINLRSVSECVLVAQLLISLHRGRRHNRTSSEKSCEHVDGEATYGSKVQHCPACPLTRTSQAPLSTNPHHFLHRSLQHTAVLKYDTSTTARRERSTKVQLGHNATGHGEQTAARAIRATRATDHLTTCFAAATALHLGVSSS